MNVYWAALISFIIYWLYEAYIFYKQNKIFDDVIKNLEYLIELLESEE